MPIRKIHDLWKLGEACASVDGSLASLEERAEDLTQFAWGFATPVSR